MPAAASAGQPWPCGVLPGNRRRPDHERPLACGENSERASTCGGESGLRAKDTEYGKWLVVAQICRWQPGRSASNEKLRAHRAASEELCQPGLAGGEKILIMSCAIVGIMVRAHGGDESLYSHRQHASEIAGNEMASALEATQLSAAGGSFPSRRRGIGVRREISFSSAGVISVGVTAAFGARP